MGPAATLGLNLDTRRTALQTGEKAPGTRTRVMWRIRRRGRSAMRSRKLVLGVEAKRRWLPFVGNYRTFLRNPLADYAEFFAIAAAV